MHIAPIVTILSIYRVDFDVVLLEDSFLGDNKNQSSEGMYYWAIVKDEKKQYQR